MSFESRHWNRRKMPTKHVLICEDDLGNQAQMALHFAAVFDVQGPVEFSFVPGGMAAAGVIGWRTVDLIILDHDMPHGNGPDLLEWMKAHDKKIPIITFSGITENNDRMMQLGAHHHFGKSQVIEGKADALIKQILGI
jgi:CheY-like chemotaxis protein